MTRPSRYVISMAPSPAALQHTGQHSPSVRTSVSWSYTCQSPGSRSTPPTDTAVTAAVFAANPGSVSSHCEVQHKPAPAGAFHHTPPARYGCHAFDPNGPTGYARYVPRRSRWVQVRMVLSHWPYWRPVAAHIHAAARIVARSCCSGV